MSFRFPGPWSYFWNLKLFACADASEKPGIQNTWCGRGDLNPHAFRRHPLKMVCLPVPPLPHRQIGGVLDPKIAGFRCQSIIAEQSVVSRQHSEVETRNQAVGAAKRSQC